VTDNTPAEGLTFADWLRRVEDKLDRAITDHENRLRTVERVMWAALGIAMVGGVSGIGSFLASLLRGA
jgi:hypothetical protein